MAAIDDLKREMQETRASVTALLVKFQELIDRLANDPGNEAEVAAIAAEMDALQTDIQTAIDSTNPPPTPVTEPTP